MADTTNAACTTCGHANPTDAPRCGGCGLNPAWTKAALPQTIDALFAACPNCAAEDCHKISHQLIYLAELIDETCAADEIYHGSFVRDEAKRVAALEAQIAAAGPAVEEIRRCVANERAVVESDIAAIRQLLADEQAAHEANHSRAMLMIGDQSFELGGLRQRLSAALALLADVGAAGNLAPAQAECYAALLGQEGL